MFLNYFSLGMLFFVFLIIFYGVIMIHDIPYIIAKKRNHPHADAIHTAGWVSLFTLHIIWPFFVDLGHALSTRTWVGHAGECRSV
ncbi:Inner membrane protein yiaW [Citrobacter koseri]|uniref:Inner membrane protein yiaW n=1 Tax=Citrobacter koseri TaxID=545 RepID=A0A2X2WP64_CITKO|nr:Inner membrane protein yiaW [Citrobacter koseri]